MTENALTIVGLNGSPHTNRNTATAMHWVLEGCERAGAKIEWHRVWDGHLGFGESQRRRCPAATSH